MNKKELIEAIAKKEGRTPEAVAYSLSLAYDEIFAAIIQGVARGENVVVPGFGIFYPQVQHLNSKHIPSAKRVPGFIPDLRFKDAVSTQRKEVQL